MNRHRVSPSLHLAVAGVIATGIGYAISPANGYALIPGLVVLALSLLRRYPDVGFYTIVFLFPFGAYRGKIHWVIAAALLIAALLHYLPRREWPQQLRSNLWPWFAAFIAVNFISACMSPYPEAAFKSLALLVAGGVFIGLSLLFVSSQGLRKVLPLLFVVSITLGSLLSVVGYVFDVSLFAVNIEKFKRGAGATVSPNSMAIFVVSVIPFLFYYLLKARAVALYLLVILAMGVNLAGIVTTYSRGGFWVMILITAACLVDFRDRWRLRDGVTFGLCLGLYVILSVLLVPATSTDTPPPPVEERPQATVRPKSKSEKTAPATPLYWKRQKSLSETGDFSVNRRRTYLQVGKEAFLERPLFGFGPMTFRQIYKESPLAQELMRKSKRRVQTVSPRVAHNTYVEVLVGGGVLGLLCFLGLIGTALWNFTRARREIILKGDRDTALLVTACRLSFACMLVYFVIQSMIYHKPFLLLLAVSQVALNISRGRSIDGSGEPAPTH